MQNQEQCVQKCVACKIRHDQIVTQQARRRKEGKNIIQILFKVAEFGDYHNKQEGIQHDMIYFFLQSDFVKMKPI